MKFLLAVPLVLGYVPERTPQREKLFFGIDTPPVAPVIPAGVLPPASSQIGVNSTAAYDHDLNDYGTLGKPAQEEEGTGITKLLFPSYFFTESKRKPVTNSSFLATAKYALEYMSVVWLILLLVGCYFFLKAAMTGALSKKYTLVSAAKEESQRDIQNRRIDREAYVYIEGG